MSTFQGKKSGTSTSSGVFGGKYNSLPTDDVDADEDSSLIHRSKHGTEMVEMGSARKRGASSEEDGVSSSSNRYHSKNE